MSLASIPHTLWHLYVDNLVKYKSDSWVYSIASTCRILAFATIIPFILLTLLDVASYIIARTLGVIDETKASTSGGEHDVIADRAHPHANSPKAKTDAAAQPKIVVEGEDSDTALAAATPLPCDDEGDEENGNLKLSGVDTFSPAPSQPGSPTLQRREFMQHQFAHYGLGASFYGRGGRLGVRDGEEEHDHSEKLRAGEGGHEDRDGDGDGDGLVDDRDGDAGEHGQHGATTSTSPSPADPSGHDSHSAGSSSGDESYAILDRDSGSDAGVVLRKRTRQTGTGPGAGDGAE